MRRFFRKNISKTWIICIVLFLGLCTLSVFAMSANTDQAKELMEEFMKMATENGIADSEGNISVTMLFLNNLKAAGLLFIIGLIPFLFLPLLGLLSNSIVVGAALGIVLSSGHDVIEWVVKGLLPHGIFEIPAICMAAALGIQVCHFMINKIFKRGKLSGYSFKEYLGESCRVFVLIIVPLLIVAAIVECYVTPHILGTV